MDTKLVEEHYDAVYKYILYLTNNADIAHELLQDTFYRYLKQQNQMVQSPRAYLIRMARNLVYDYFRRKRLLEFVSFKNENQISTYALPDELLTKNEEIQTLYKAIQKLKPQYREVIILRYIEEYSVAEVALMLGKNEVYVKNNTARGLKTLRDIMGGGAGHAKSTAKGTATFRKE